jgi:hypothetical protein
MMIQRADLGTGGKELISNGWFLQETARKQPGTIFATLSDPNATSRMARLDLADGVTFAGKAFLDIDPKYALGWIDDSRLCLFAPSGIIVNGAKHTVIPLPWLHDIFSEPVRTRSINPDLKLSALAIDYLSKLEIQRLALSPTPALQSYEMALQLKDRLQSPKRCNAQRRYPVNSQYCNFSGKLQSGGMRFGSEIAYAIFNFPGVGQIEIACHSLEDLRRKGISFSDEKQPE